MAIAFPRWMAMSSRCLRKAVDLGSPVNAAIFPPKSAVRPSALAPQAPKVSTATGTNVYARENSRPEYLDLLRSSAPAAADPAAKEDWFRCEGARVSGHVKSHTRHFPRA